MHREFSDSIKRREKKNIESLYCVQTDFKMLTPTLSFVFVLTFEIIK